MSKGKKIKLSQTQIEGLYDEFCCKCSKMSKVNSEVCEYKPNKQSEANCMSGLCLAEYIVKYMQDTYDVREK